MGKPLRVLIVEDSPDDTELLLRELRRGGYDPIYDRVETASAMKVLLEKQEWDIVLSDHSLPLFSAFGALTQLQLSNLDLPFIIVSGVIGEDIAVAAMKAGAHDYIMKDNLSRLVPAIERELKEAEKRRQCKLAEEEKIRLREQLYHAQKLESIGKLIGNIAHDFNNTLSVIIGYVELLQNRMEKDALSTDLLKDYIGRIHTVVETAIHLTQDLLTFSRKEINNPKPINLNTIIRRTRNLLSGLICENIKLEMDLTGENTVIMADSSQIEQVLMNLATNARDAMPDGGVLRIGTKVVELDDTFVKSYGYGETGHYMLMSVSDTGMGIDEETKKIIFEPFFTTKRRGKGTGLGLAIVYGIVRQHLGYIQVDSEPGKGAVFKIYLPIAESVADEEEPESFSHSVRGTETILLADDNAEIRNILKTVFHESGYKVIEALNGEDAVDKFMKSKDEIQILVFDVIMPKKNGKEAYDEIRKIRPEIKVLFTSGYSKDDVNKTIIEAGLPLLPKPVSPAKILRKVRESLDT